jgi:hypothetical protein
VSAVFQNCAAVFHLFRECFACARRAEGAQTGRVLLLDQTDRAGTGFSSESVLLLSRVDACRNMMADATGKDRA